MTTEESTADPIVQLDKCLEIVVKSYSSVVSVAFSPDGSKIVSGSADKTIRLWHASTGQTIRTFTGHTSTVSSVAFSPDGSKIVSGSWDDTIRLWDASTGQTTHTFTGHEYNVSSIAFSSDGRKIVSGSFTQIIVLENPFNTPHPVMFVDLPLEMI
jgi:WD40 repeat protein